MKVLILNASPRREGNTELLCREFARGAAEASHDVTQLNLRQMKLAPCMACEACRQSGQCVLHDDMAGIYAAMVEADVIVLSSPVYFYSICAQMKMVIDRCYVGHRKLAHKRFYYIVPAAAPDHRAAAPTLEAFRGFLRCLPDATECGTIYGTGAWAKGDIRTMPAMQEAYTMGREV